MTTGVFAWMLCRRPVGMWTYVAPDNLAVAVTSIGKIRFREGMIDDPAGYFKGNAIRVTGTVILKENRPGIEVDDPSQIEVVEKTK